MTTLMMCVVGLAGVSYISSLHSMLQDQHEHIMQFRQDTPALYTVDVHPPAKFAIEHVTPRKTQDHRGTCWDFATIGVLEQSYRAQGIANGWLDSDEYLPLSEQAYGAEILRLCSGPFDSPQQIACRVPGNSIWQNSTEGGESSELYYLVNGLKNGVFPHNICPYVPSEGRDRQCDGLTQDKRDKNPLLFEINGMETFYDDLTVKTKLFNEKKAMSFTTMMPYITHYYPCIGPFKSDPRCQEDSPACVLCPPELSMSTCCVPLNGGENYNMAGEFIAHRGMTLEGGHVMTLVGFNDAFRTKDGFTGGYILKNSWFDGTEPPLGPRIARGSHSMRYWMQEISDWEERTMCPNSHVPYNWYQCGNSKPVTHGSTGFNRSRAFNEGIDACLSAETKLYADTNIQPLHLRCRDEAFCKTDPEHVYFVRNTTEWGDRMTMMCVFEHNNITSAARDFCLPPMLIQKIAYIFEPMEKRDNDPDQCGFYFFPYEVVRQYVSMFEGFYVNSFDIKWHPQSYLKNQHHYPHLDYSNVQNSMRKQKKYNFVGPFPFARVVDHL